MTEGIHHEKKEPAYFCSAIELNCDLEKCPATGAGSREYGIACGIIWVLLSKVLTPNDKRLPTLHTAYSNQVP